MSVAGRIRYWLLLLPLLGLLAATYWLNLQTQGGPAKAAANSRHSIDALMENFSATKMDAQGLPHFTVSAKQLHHYPEDDSTTLTEPLLAIFSNEGTTIRASAREGKISSKGDEVFLQDTVEMLRDTNDPQNKLTLVTEYLHILPNRNLMTTDRPVTLTDAHTTVHATGLEMDYKMRVFKLLSHVRSVYVPAKK